MGAQFHSTYPAYHSAFSTHQVYHFFFVLIEYDKHDENSIKFLITWQRKITVLTPNLKFVYRLFSPQLPNNKIFDIC